MDKIRSILAGMAAAVGAAPNCTAAAVVALLGLGGSATAALVQGWLTPVLIVLSILLLSRSFYILYVKRRGTRTTAVITWLSASFVVAFWSWQVAGTVMAEEQTGNPDASASCPASTGCSSRPSCSSSSGGSSSCKD